MEVWLDDKALIYNIIKYDNFDDTDTSLIFSSIPIEESIKIIHISIWDSENNTADIIVTAIKQIDGICVMGNNKVFKVCSFNMNIETPQNVKDEGKRLKDLLLKTFKNKDIKVTSNLHYKD